MDFGLVGHAIACRRQCGFMSRGFMSRNRMTFWFFAMMTLETRRVITRRVSRLRGPEFVVATAAGNAMHNHRPEAYKITFYSGPKLF